MTERETESVRVSLQACPICGNPVVARYRPFCSSRCNDIDLGRWMNGTYRIETDEIPEVSDLEEKA